MSDMKSLSTDLKFFYRYNYGLVTSFKKSNNDEGWI